MKSFARWKVLGAMAAAWSVSMLALQACGGDDKVGGDAGPDGTAGDVTNPDVADVAIDSPPIDAAACPSYSGSVAFCKAVVARCAACGATATNFTACQLQNFDALCAWVDGVFSPQVQSASQSCATICDQTASNACISGALADASLSTAQDKTVTDYCARCALDAGCAAQTAAAINIVDLSDTLAATIDTQCTPDAGGPDSSACGAAYQLCAGQIITGALNSSPCSDAGGD
jgi:hypothetical protein